MLVSILNNITKIICSNTQVYIEANGFATLVHTANHPETVVIEVSFPNP